MNKDFITIQDAASVSGKSVQTIRRAIKSKKLKVKKERTPQGFNYLINREAFFAFYKIENPSTANNDIGVATTQATKRNNKKKTQKTDEMSLYIKREELMEFNKTLQHITHEHAQERQNYLRLVQALQEKITALENQFKLLQESTVKKWYHFWK